MSYTLDDIRAAADKKYGSYDINLGDGATVRLLNPLRLHADKRAELSALQTELKGVDTEGDEAVADVDQADVFRRMIRTVADVPALAERLIELVGDDLGVLATIVSDYGKGTQQGEASASAA